MKHCLYDGDCFDLTIDDDSEVTSSQEEIQLNNNPEMLQRISDTTNASLLPSNIIQNGTISKLSGSFQNKFTTVLVPMKFPCDNPGIVMSSSVKNQIRNLSKRSSISNTQSNKIGILDNKCIVSAGNLPSSDHKDNDVVIIDSPNEATQYRPFQLSNSLQNNSTRKSVHIKRGVGSPDSTVTSFQELASGSMYARMQNKAEKTSNIDRNRVQRNSDSSNGRQTYASSNGLSTMRKVPNNNVSSTTSTSKNYVVNHNGLNIFKGNSNPITNTSSQSCNSKQKPISFINHRGQEREDIQRTGASKIINDIPPLSSLSILSALEENSEEDDLNEPLIDLTRIEMLEDNINHKKNLGKAEPQIKTTNVNFRDRCQLEAKLNKPSTRGVFNDTLEHGFTKTEICKPVTCINATLTNLKSYKKQILRLKQRITKADEKITNSMTIEYYPIIKFEAEDNNIKIEHEQFYGNRAQPRNHSNYTSIISEVGVELNIYKELKSKSKNFDKEDNPEEGMAMIKKGLEIIRKWSKIAHDLAHTIEEGGEKRETATKKRISCQTAKKVEAKIRTSTRKKRKTTRIDNERNKTVENVRKKTVQRKKRGNVAPIVGEDSGAKKKRVSTKKMP